MGAHITISNERSAGSEPVGDVTVRSSALRGTTISGELIPRLIDEIPVLAVAAACAAGDTLIRDAQELRVKETDRITTVVSGLQALGRQAAATEDGMIITGSQGRPFHSATLHSAGDHRLAMAWGVAALIAQPETTITDAQVAQVSYPDFWEKLTSLTDIC
jgi:3-phosphoshikimate 1-carboxyvinyltransferase